MLVSLAIRDIVLIERLALAFDAGLTVLTGETGAGKSILLDSLGLATGARADSALVRYGAERGSVTAGFEPAPGHPVWALLAERGVPAEDGALTLRRVVNADGRSRAFANDQPVSVSLLRRLGDALVEMHGQHDDRGLLDPAGHRRLLDAYGGLAPPIAAVAEGHKALKEAESRLAEAERLLAAARADEDFLRHSLGELDALTPETGEEDALAAERTRMMQGERLAGDLSDVHGRLTADEGVDALLRGLLRRLERLDPEAQDLLQPVIAALDKAAIETGEGIAALEQIRLALDFDPARLEQAEERLFALRALARKHKCAADDLASLRETFAARLAAMEKGDDDVAEGRAAVAARRDAFRHAVETLRADRLAAAERLDKAVNAELPPLKLEKARFRTVVAPLEEREWGRDGGDKVAFEVATNPEAPFGPLIKIASGGELARFVLALKVSLAARGSAPTLIFDEVDRGIGGATADAVGERLARLAADAQVLVVTHSPQVAARGDQHFRIAKSAADGAATVTDVAVLGREDRREEIARMLSGARITDEARAAASSLMQKSA